MFVWTGPEVVMCDCRDRLTGNDAIGTAYLNLANIASSGGEIEGNHLFMSTLSQKTGPRRYILALN